jgi:hypothetical protein
MMLFDIALMMPMALAFWRRRSWNFGIINAFHVDLVTGSFGKSYWNFWRVYC